MDNPGLWELFLASGVVWLLLLAYSLKLRANQRRLESELRLLHEFLVKDEENCS